MATHTDTRTATPADLAGLVARVADGDRLAFADLHTATADRLADAGLGAVATATFVEVWWLARHHCGPGSDVAGWIVDVARRRAADAVDADTARRAEVLLAGLLDRRSAAVWDVPRRWRWSAGR